jgi:Fe-S-cluster containining protein
MIPDSEDAMFDIWVNPKTQDFVSRCPWLRKEEGADVYDCAIHDVKPAACREWPASIDHGKKLGCPACQEKLPGKTGEVIKVIKPRRDDE